MSCAVLLPGLDGTGALLESFAQSLGKVLACTTISYPAKFASSYVELERIALAALPAEEPYILIGESFSGPIAISLAAKAPPNMKGLVLCATFARSPIPLRRLFAPFVRYAPTHLPMFVLRHLLLGKWATSSIEQTLATALAEIPAEVLRKRVGEVLKVDVSNQLSSIKIPVMYLQAAQDRLISSSAREYLHRVNPVIKMVSVDGPHFLLQTAPENCIEKISKFAKEVGLQSTNSSAIS